MKVLVANTYVIDSNSLISAWFEFYPEKNFPGIWSKFADLIEQKRLVILQPVADEVKDKSDQLRSWVQKYKKLFIPVDQGLQDKQEEIMRPLANQPQRIAAFHGADPYLVAYASMHACVVITQEKEQQGKVMIPSACKERNISCKPILHIIQSESWIF